jgi:hypothetical protein
MSHSCPFPSFHVLSIQVQAARSPVTASADATAGDANGQSCHHAHTRPPLLAWPVSLAQLGRRALSQGAILASFSKADKLDAPFENAFLSFPPWDEGQSRHASRWCLPPASSGRRAIWDSTRLGEGWNHVYRTVSPPPKTSAGRGIPGPPHRGSGRRK